MEIVLYLRTRFERARVGALAIVGNVADRTAKTLIAFNGTEKQRLDRRKAYYAFASKLAAAKRWFMAA